LYINTETRKFETMELEHIKEFYSDLVIMIREIVERDYQPYHKNDALVICKNVIKYFGPNPTRRQVESEIETFYNS
jgi:hypothetical protein